MIHTEDQHYTVPLSTLTLQLLSELTGGKPENNDKEINKAIALMRRQSSGLGAKVITAKLPDKAAAKLEEAGKAGISPSEAINAALTQRRLDAVEPESRRQARESGAYHTTQGLILGSNVGSSSHLSAIFPVEIRLDGANAEYLTRKAEAEGTDIFSSLHVCLCLAWGEMRARKAKAAAVKAEISALNMDWMRAEAGKGQGWLSTVAAAIAGWDGKGLRPQGAALEPARDYIP